MSEAADLVRKYGEGKCKFDELVGFVKCQECFSTLMGEITQQLGSNSDAAGRMASQFPEMFTTYGRAVGLYNDVGNGEEEGGDGGDG